MSLKNYISSNDSESWAILDEKNFAIHWIPEKTSTYADLEILKSILDSYGYVLEQSNNSVVDGDYSPSQLSELKKKFLGE